MFFVQMFAQQLPVVAMHGIISEAEHMDTLLAVLKQEIPGLYAKSCEVGTGTYSSVFMNIREQVDELSMCINNDPKLKDGFILIGHSQGGFLARSYIQLYNHMKAPVKRLITLSSPLGGFFCGIKSKCANIGIPDFILNMAAELIYSDYIQELIGPTGYWRDPYRLDLYQKDCGLLPELDNIRNYDEQRRQNYIGLDLHIAYGSEKDEIIAPWRSAWFGVWNDDNDASIVAMENRPEYQQDLFGLKTMTDKKRLILIESGLRHNAYLKNQTWIKANLPQWVRTTQ